jgi:hypothetical protein
MPTRKRPSPALVISLLALFVSLSGIGVAATGGNFILGQLNTSDDQTQLTGTVNSNPQLRVQNAATSGAARGVVGRMTAAGATGASAGVLGATASTDPTSVGVIAQNTGGGPALSAIVNSGVAPLKVNSGTKVDNLNADKLDGVDSTGFLQPSVIFDEVSATITSPSGGYGSDPISPGPSVTVTVPDEGGGTGFIQVWAQVHANESSTAVGLFDTTGGGPPAFVAGQDTVCPDRVTALPPGTLPGDLFITADNDGLGVEGDYGTPETVNQGVGDCASGAGAPTPVLFEVTAGTHTFELEYADCGCGGTPEVSNRRLWIAPLRLS